MRKPLQMLVLALTLGLGTALALPAAQAAAPDTSLRIGIIGTGRIGGALARAWVKAGHEVFVSSRHPDELKGLVAELAGKVILDTSNPVESRDGAMAADAQKLGAGPATAELLQSKRVVRAFNCIGAASLANDGFHRPERLAIPIGGDDTEALAIAQRLISEIGFDPVVIGSLARTRGFDLGQPLATGQLTAAEMRAKLAQLAP
jgi:8-hydroxy-5-deazaflavin:NADPH oxidoreductase